MAFPLGGARCEPIGGLSVSLSEALDRMYTHRNRDVTDIRCRAESFARASTSGRQRGLRAFPDRSWSVDSATLARTSRTSGVRWVGTRLMPLSMAICRSSSLVLAPRFPRSGSVLSSTSKLSCGSPVGRAPPPPPPLGRRRPDLRRLPPRDWDRAWVVSLGSSCWYPYEFADYDASVVGQN